MEQYWVKGVLRVLFWGRFVPPLLSYGKLWNNTAWYNHGTAAQARWRGLPQAAGYLVYVIFDRNCNIAYGILYEFSLYI